MSFADTLAAVVVGGLLTGGLTLLGVWITAKKAAENAAAADARRDAAEHLRWTREKRFEAYSLVLDDRGRHSDDRGSPGRAASSWIWTAHPATRASAADGST